MTNIVMNVVVVVALAAVCVPVLRRRAPGTRSGPLLVAGAVMVALTLVFDTVMIAAGLYTYAPDKILGVRLWGAPLEDFAYPVAAVLLVPATWTVLEGRARRVARAAAEETTATETMTTEER
ncbi:lycopene cyclase domain-containing protein [Cellulomonas sp. PhB143]|uniref:lycopene cyclase domain-containing protein n=1 Tax=Cellulomonas sp. PhB143 TaxID=2485186 RepID=UPI000F4813CA|nr:lycopene cyclase domain-containing protein [Cellulomonas sp. PhB143]ROS76543.1 lycopene cyclase domain-containing protein [Cellulomonas sp. PhB143]